MNIPSHLYEDKDTYEDKLNKIPIEEIEQFLRKKKLERIDVKIKYRLALKMVR